MRRLLILYLGLLVGVFVHSQNIVYRSIANFMSHNGDTILSMEVSKRSQQEIMLINGGEYKITSSNRGLSRYIRSKSFLVSQDTNLYVNCRKLSYLRYRFGKFYEKAYVIGNMIYFASHPLGQMASLSFINEESNKLTGSVGDAIAACCLPVKVIYQLNPLTGKVSFVGKQFLLSHIKNISSDLQNEIERLPDESANLLFPYLKFIK